VGGSTIITGNLTVNGTTEYTNVTNLAIQDPIISIGRGANNAALLSNDSKDRGEQLWYFSTAEKSAFIGYDISAGKLIAAQEVSITNEIVTVSSYGTLVVGILEGTSVSVTGNVTGGNIMGGANVNATTHTGTTVSVTANVQGGNLRTTGLISATGNVTAGNVLGGANVNATTHTGTTVSVSGTVTGGNITVSGSGFLNLANIGGVSNSVPSGAVTGSMWYRSTNGNIQVLIGATVYNLNMTVA